MGNLNTILRCLLADCVHLGITLKPGKDEIDGLESRLDDRLDHQLIHVWALGMGGYSSDHHIEAVCKV